MNEITEQQQELPQIPPPNYLAWAIITTILCCLPFGIVSIIYSAQVNTKWAAGDIAGAQLSSKNAKTWAWVSFAVGICGMIIWTILVVVGVIAGIGLDALDL